jgi:hypothetical protein
VHLSAYEAAFLSQVRYIQNFDAKQAISLLAQAVRDFASALELGYPTEAIEVNNWFYRSLVVNDDSLAHFFAALPKHVWPYGDAFPRFQAFFGFALFRGQDEQVSEILDFLHGLCAEVDQLAAESEEQQKNCYYLMKAVFEQDSFAATSCLQKRTELRPIVPPEGTRYERFQPVDLIGLGICRLARLRGMTVNIDHPSLPLALLDQHKATRGR